MYRTALTRVTNWFLYVYKGHGVSERCTDRLFASLSYKANPGIHSVRYITPEEIIEGKWTDDAALLAIGGGHDSGLVQSLGTRGVQVIRKYVGGGGSYLGLCSGAYFASDQVQFDKGGPLEVNEERNLKFFPGLCIGPAYPGFQYGSHRGALAVPTEFRDASGQRITFHSYYNGGGFFQTYDQSNHSPAGRPRLATTRNSRMSNANQPETVVRGDKSGDSDTYDVQRVEVLARYTDLEHSPACIVKATVGNQGVAILAGIHLECGMKHTYSGDDVDLKTMTDKLVASEGARKECMTSLLRHLGVSCVEPEL